VLLRRLIIAAAIAVGMTLSATLVQADPLITLPIDKPFLVKNWNYLFHIKSIETVTPIGNPPFLKKMNDCSKGYIMLVASVQYNSDSGSAFLPGVTMSFELADGSEADGPQGDGSFLYPSFANEPPHLFAKEHRDIAYITCQWSGQPLTKLIWANKYRFNIPKGYVKSTVVAPAVSPSP